MAARERPKASTYARWKDVLRLASNPTAVDVLDFSDFVEVHGRKALDAVFPIIGAGKVDPPPEYLVTGAKVREWRTFNRNKQLHELERIEREGQRQRRAVTASRTRGRTRRTRGEGDTPAPSAYVDRLVSNTATPAVQQPQQQGVDEQQRRGGGESGSAAASAPPDAPPAPAPAADTDGRPLSAPKRAKPNDGDQTTLEEEVAHQQRQEQRWAASATPANAVPSTAAPVERTGEASAQGPVKRAKIVHEAQGPVQQSESRAVAFACPQSTQNRSGSPEERPVTDRKEPPPTQHKRRLEDDLEEACSHCRGITRQIIQQSTCSDKLEIEKGFNHLVGNAIREMGSVISNTGEWNYGDGIVGFLMDNNQRRDKQKFSWKCVQSGHNQWEFHRNNCDNSHSVHHACCERCWGKRHDFYNMCRGEREWRRKGDDGGGAVKGRQDLMAFKSPTVVLPRLAEMSKQIKVLQNKCYRTKDVVKMMRRDRVEMSNMNADVMFDPKELKRLYEDLLSQDEVPEREIFDYLFNECIVVGKRIKKQGHAKGHQYSGLMIQFACMLRKRCSVDMYDFFRRAFNLPTNQCLCEYNSTDSTSADGLMMETIIHTAKIFDMMEIPRGDWRRYLNLSWDSHVIKDLLGFCPHTKRLVGYAHDAFDLDIVKEEFKRRYKDVSTAEAESRVAGGEGDSDDSDGGSSDDEPEEKKLELGKHYMAFIAQTWTSKAKAFRFMVARYCLSSLTGRWVRVNKRQITAGLAFFSFIVNANSFDGASENRSAMKQDLTLTLKDVLPELCDASPAGQPSIEAPAHDADDGANEEPAASSNEGPDNAANEEEGEPADYEFTNEDAEAEAYAQYFEDAARHPEAVDPPRKRYKLDELPWDLPVAYRHPTIEGVLIVSAADMPHSVKKQVNASEFSGKPKSKRDLHLNGLPIQLRMGYDAYRQSMDYQCEGAISMYRNLSVDVYEKNTSTRMKFGLSARAFGGSMIRCIEQYAPKVEKASARRTYTIVGSDEKLTPPSTYDSYLLMCRHTDRFIDIMNGNRDKGCSLIDSPNDPQLFELLDYVQFLTQWKAQAVAGNRYHYFPESTHEDSCWTALSVVIMARKQLPQGQTIVQKRSGSDVCERSFAVSRRDNVHGTAQGTDGSMANQMGGALQNMAASRKGNTNKEKVYRMGEIEAMKVKRPPKLHNYKTD